MATNSKLYPKKVDLTNCDKEPIHLINKIQEHGFLLICDQQSRKIIGHSTNCVQVIGADSTEIMGSNLSGFLPSDIVEHIFSTVSSKETQFIEVDLNAQGYLAIYHFNGKEVLVEFEKKNQTIDATQQQLKLSSILSNLNVAPNVQEMCNKAAQLIRGFTDYDRVMIYRFDEHWNGEVISESKQDELESWLGLRYPATDIPQQARALFLKMGVRIISDVKGESVPVLATGANSIDFTMSELRAVSPIHIEYLENMQVGATMTAAIVYENHLWGLIACHHYSQKFTDYHTRLSCKFLTQVFSNQLGLRSINANLEKMNLSNTMRSRLIEQISVHWNIVDGLRAGEYNILKLNDAEGAIAYFDKTLLLFGKTPSEKEVLQLINWLRQNAEKEIYVTDSLIENYPKANSIKHVASGLLALFMTAERNDVMLWFKPERIRTVTWGGDPTKSVVTNGSRLSPRKSFEKWQEEQKGHSNPWEDYEIASAKALKEHLTEIVLGKYGEVLNLNERLRAVNEELESFSYSVSHDLRAPLRGIAGFSQLLKEQYYDQLDDFGKSALQTITSSSDKMNSLIDDILSFSGLGKKGANFADFNMDQLVQEVLGLLKAVKPYPNTTIKVSGAMGAVKGDRAMVAQLLKNLIGNALKYTSKVAQPKIEIGYEDKHFFVRDNGIGFDMTMKEKVFGVFTRLVSDDEYEGSGIGLAIAKRVVEKHKGRIWVESMPGEGTTFFFTLNPI